MTELQPCKACKGDGFRDRSKPMPCACRSTDECEHRSRFYSPAHEPEAGLYHKYWVRRTDGSSRKGCKHANCDYLVLDFVHDPFAIPAALAYADACEMKLPDLARDIRTRVRHAQGEREKGRPSMTKLKMHLDVARTPEKLAGERKELCEFHGLPESTVFTCDGCGIASTCTFVFDAYNTDGDCLASK